MANISERLRELRKEKKISQGDVAQMLSLSLTAYNRYELGSAEPNITNMIKLAKFYDVSIDYLVGITDVRDKTEIVEMLDKLDSDDQNLVSRLIKRCSKK